MADDPTPRAKPDEQSPDVPPPGPADVAVDATDDDATEEEVLVFDTEIEEVGVCRKKLTVTIPRETIDGKFDAKFDELQEEALVPGFRPGHAPRRLIEKRFHRAVAEELAAELAAGCLHQALEREALQILGEPDLDPDALEVPEEGPMTFSVELEVRPEFELPDIQGIPVEVERHDVTDEEVEAALDRLRRMHAEPRRLSHSAKAKEDDILVGDFRLEAGGETLAEREGARIPVAAITVEGVPLENFVEIVSGAKAGETREGTVTVPDTSPRENLRGKDAKVTVAIKEIERPEPPSDEALLEQAGEESMEDLKGALRRRLQVEADQAYDEAQRRAIEDWLLEHTDFELPEGLVERYAESVHRRRLTELLYRGVPAEELTKREEELRSASGERSRRDLKLQFILDAIAKKEDITATDAEVDARVRYIASQYGRKEDRVREEMAERGQLDAMYGQIRDDKVMRLLVEKAQKRGEEESPAGEADSGEADSGEASEDVEST